ncbi:MAG: L-rhamnose mutarotase [Paracoccaceae bacterium]
MEKFAFKMQLSPGQRDEYKRRHDEIWPELSRALTDAGVSDYSIHLDPETNILFATMWRRKDHDLDALSETDLMQKWWSYMADIMQTHDSNEPVATPLETLFHMR